MDKTEGEAWHQHGISAIVRSTERLCFYNKFTHLQNYHLSEKSSFYFQYLLTINDRAYVAITFKYPNN